MAPTRTQKTTKRVQHSQPKPAASSTPGVSKLKASLRQTQRLLVKDNIAADVRLKTERRLQALQDELAEAQMSKKEQALSTRYHGIKFFERQKVTRKIKQLKKQHAAAEGSARQKHAIALTEARVDLNYILHYPRLQKYISLFPPEVRKGDPKPISSSETDAQRNRIRTQIRQQMLSGELPTEPDTDLSQKPPQKRRPTDAKATASVPSGTFEEVKDDAFFGEDGDGDEDSDEDADEDSS